MTTSQPRAGDFQPAGSGHPWKSDLCDCWSDACCQTLFCHWCMLCASANTMGECACVGCPLCECPCTMMLRTKTRHVIGIRGSLCCDLCASQFCPLCVTYQIYHELEEFTGASPHRDLCECPCDGDHQCSC